MPEKQKDAIRELTLMLMYLTSWMEYDTVEFLGNSRLQLLETKSVVFEFVVSVLYHLVRAKHLLSERGRRNIFGFVVCVSRNGHTVQKRKRYRLCVHSREFVVYFGSGIVFCLVRRRDSQ